MDASKTADIKVGVSVSIVLKQDQRSGDLTEGIVEKILSNSSNHPHGIKVRLQYGQVGSNYRDPIVTLKGDISSALTPQFQNGPQCWRRLNNLHYSSRRFTTS